MHPNRKETAARVVVRINLRLDPETFEAIDAARSLRPGNVSRNTWISEAIREKIAREAPINDSPRRRD